MYIRIHHVCEFGTEKSVLTQIVDFFLLTNKYPILYSKQRYQSWDETQTDDVTLK